VRFALAAFACCGGRLFELGFAAFFGGLETLQTLQARTKKTLGRSSTTFTIKCSALQPTAVRRGMKHFQWLHQVLTLK
jgi:hypothetical protein